MASLPEGPGVNRANIFNRVIGGTAIEVLVTLRAAAAGRDTCSTRVPRVPDDRDRPHERAGQLRTHSQGSLPSPGTAALGVTLPTS